MGNEGIYLGADLGVSVKETWLIVIGHNHILIACWHMNYSVQYHFDAHCIVVMISKSISRNFPAGPEGSI